MLTETPDSTEPHVQDPEDEQSRERGPAGSADSLIGELVDRWIAGSLDWLIAGSVYCRVGPAVERALEFRLMRNVFPCRFPIVVGTLRGSGIEGEAQGYGEATEYGPFDTAMHPSPRLHTSQGKIKTP